MGAWTWVPLDEVVADEAVEESFEPEVALRFGGQEEPVIDSLQMRSGYLYSGSFRINWDDSSGPQLESVASVGGRFVKNGNNLQPRYYITDYLGSTRIPLSGRRHEDLAQAFLQTSKNQPITKTTPNFSGLFLVFNSLSSSYK